MHIVVTGGTGFIGAPLCRALQAAGHVVTIVGRRPGYVPARIVTWDRVGEVVAAADAIVHLAGAPVAEGRWTAARKREIRESRVLTTRAVVEAIAAASTRPRVLVGGSAIGWYGPHGDEPLDESAPSGDGFLAEVCRDWEAETVRAEAFGVRTVRLRIGVVLGAGGGALAQMLTPFRAGLGGPLGSGRQVVSWIHRDDVIGLVQAALAGEGYRGAVNATAPTPVTNRELATTLGRLLARPALLPAPGFALRLLLGEMASMLLTGQRVLPRVATDQGYTWKYPAIADALRACLDG